MTVDLSVSTGVSSLPVSDPIGPSALGIEFLGWETFGAFTDRLASVGAGHVRWPGAIPVEDGIDTNGDGAREAVFDLRAPDLITGWDRANGPREGLSDILAVTNAAHASFAMIVPTARYVEAGLTGDPATALASARADIRQFLERLAAGAFGDVPADFTLEIGSEYFVTEVWKNNTDIPDLAARFGDVFAALADEVKATVADLNALGLNAQGIDPSVAVQVARLQSADDVGNADGQFADNSAFLQAFRDADAAHAIDALIWHRYIPDFENIGLFVDRAPPGGYADPSHALWSTTEGLWQDLTGRPLELVGGWLSPATQQESSLEFGAPGLSNILQHFSSMMAAGMDTGTIFGFGAGRTGSLGRAEETFIGGQLYQMMVESLQGTVVHDGFQSNISPVANGALVRTDHVNTHVFESETEVVIFLAARDFAGQVLDYTLGIDRPVYGAAARHLADVDGTDRITADQIGVVGVVSDWAPDVSGADGRTEITVRFTHDYEVIRLTLSKTPPDQAPAYAPTVFGTEEVERIAGTPGNDVIDAGGGDDRLRGLDGEDVLIDGAGRDNMWGGAGADTFVLVADGVADSIKDFQSGIDRIDLSDWGVRGVGELEMFLSRSGKTVIRSGDEVLSISTDAASIPQDLLDGSALDFAAVESSLLVVEGTRFGDRLIGSDAAEVLRDGAGKDALFGRGGADIFQLAADGVADGIKDFEAGVDRIDLIGWDVGTPEDLELSMHRTGRVVIRHQDEVLSVAGRDGALTVAEVEAALIHG